MVTLSRACLALLSVLVLSACSDEKPDIRTPVIGDEPTPSTNVAPLITSAAVTTATEGQPYSYQPVVNDPDDINDGGNLTWQLLSAPAGMRISSTGLITWTPPNGVTSVPVRVVVRDGGENGARPAEQTFVIVVAPVNDAPSITSVAPTSAVRGNPYQYTLVVADPDDSNNGVNLQFELLQAPVGMTISPTGVIQWTPPTAGVSEAVSVRVRDGGEDGAAPAVQNFTINVVGANTPPQITSAAVTTASEDVPYQYSVQVTDAEDANNGADLTFALLEAPAGMTISPQGVIDWTPPENGAAPWSADVEVQVADGGEDGSLPATQAFSINVTPVNDAPTVTSLPSTSATEGASYQYQLVINDPDDANNGTDLQFSLLDAPAGMTVSPTGLISWTAGSSNADVQVQVTDGGEDGAAAATQSWTINIDTLNDAPQITSTAPTTATEGQLYEYAITVEDPDDANNGTDLSFTLLTAPAGMTISPTGVISWTPGEGGATPWQESVQVEVADGGENGAAAAVQSWIIDVTPVNSAPQFTETSPQLVTMSEDGAPQAFSLTLNATDADNSGSDMSWSVATPATHGTASVSGNGFGKAIDYVPNADYAGADSFVVEINDGELNAQITVDVTVMPVNDAPQITSVAPAAATEGVLYQYALQVADIDDANDGTALQFSLLNAPTGMTVSSTGVIQWTPADGVASADVSVQVADGGEDGAAPTVQSWTINVSATNSAPVITQGDSINVLMSEDGVPTPFAVSVDATDADAGTTLTWDLQGAASNGVASVSGTGSTPVISYAPNANFAGNDSFVVRVSDGEASDAITINVNVAAVNDAPAFMSSAITTATEGVAYQYNAQASDVDGPALAWTLTSAPAGMTIDSNSGVIDWLPGEGGAAPWQENVTVQVSDGILVDTQSFTISVTPVNNAPSITSTPSTGATEAVLYSYQIVVADSDDSNNGTDITFTLTDAPAGMTVSPTGLVQWTPAAGVGSANVSVQVSDGGENGATAATQSWTITVDDSNDAPTITSVAPTTATEGSEYSYQLVVNDPDDANNGTDLSFSLTQAPSGMSVSATGLITWAPVNGVSSAEVSVQVADGGENGAAPATQSWTITVDGVNDAPVITEGASVNVSMSEDGTPTAFALTLNATDIDSSTLAWSILAAATNGAASASGTGNSKAISYVPAADFNGSDSFVVRVSYGELSDDITVNVTVEAINDAPQITSTPSLSATESVLYQYQASSSDVDGPSATWSLSSAPAGMTVSSAGLVQWTPPENGADPWTANVQLQVSDGEQSATQDFTVTVTPENNAPVISEGDSVNVSMSEDGTPTAFALTLNATDADSATLTWSVASAATNGTAAATGTGNSKAITYTPNADYVGSDSFVIRVSDGTLSDDITVNVTIGNENDAPVITSTPVTSASEDAPYQYAVTADDLDGDTLEWSLTTAPAGMTISATTGVIDWTPAENGASDWDADVTVQVSDGTENATQSFSITVVAINDAPEITSAPSTSATEGQLYSYQVVVNDPDDANNGADLTFALIQAPAGMTLSPSGLLAWTPANGTVSASVEISVADGGENGAVAATQSWTISVGDVNDAPTITSVAPTSATEGALYSYQLIVNDPDDANNGTDLSFALTQSPSGMTVSATGLVTWTPGENGSAPWTANVAVQVADGGENGAAPATQSFTINVTPVNNAPTIDQGDSVAVTMSEDGAPTAFAVVISASDADTAAGSLAWSLGGAASNGTATASGSGASPAVTYVPNADFVGNDSFVVSVSDGEFSDSITVNVAVQAQNDAPVITSAAITSATEDALYQYDADVTDADGPSATWTLVSAPAGMVIDPATGVISWTPGEGGAALWNTSVTVQVSDGTLTDSQSFSISVTPVNDAPLVSSSPSTSATEGNLYSYQLVVVDPDDSNNGTDISFDLVTAPVGMTVSATGLVEWTPADGVSSADVTVQVADGGENGVAAVTQSWTITVGATNDAPTITSTPPTTATQAVPYSYQLVVSDTDDSNNGIDISFNLTTAPAGMTVSATGLVEWTPPNGITSADVTVEAADGGEDGAAPAVQSWTISVTDTNDAPQISQGDSVSVTMSEDGAPTAFALTLDATDIDGDTLTWSIASAASHGVASASGTGSSPTVNYAPTANFNGSDSFVVSVSDGTLSDTVTVNVTVEAQNDAPTITSTALTTATEAVLYQYQVTAEDVDGPSASWSLANAPVGMTISAAGLIQWTPAENGDSDWTADVTAQVSDGTDTDTQSFTITVTAVNNAPVITEGASVGVTMSEDATPTAFALTLNVTDADTAPGSLAWSISSAASNGTATVTGTGLSKVIGYTPNADFSGADSFEVTVSDGALSDTITVNVTVDAQNDAPVISSDAVTTATEDSAYSYDVDVTDIDGPGATFSLTTAPAGMTIDSSTGVISWTPGEGGASLWSEAVTVEVTDGTDTDSQSFTIDVTPVNDAPSITSTAPTSGVEGGLYSYAVAVSDSDDANNGTDLSWSLTAAPAGMTVSSTGLIEWTPPNGVTSANVTVQVADGGENGAAPAAQSWTISIGATNDAPSITSVAPTTASEDAPYTYQLTVNDPDDANNGTDLSWSLTTAPAGMTISSTGLINWTPGEGGAAPWTADVTVQVADGGENGALPDTQSFTISVTPVNDAPVIDQGASMAVAMSEDGVPTAFSVAISATDADTASGSLGWSLGSAAAHGTATASGTGASPTVTYMPNANFSGSDSFVVTVSDGEFSDSITVNVTIAAENDAPQITSAAVTAATEDVLYQYAAAVSDIDGPSASWSLTTAPAGMTVSAAGLVQWTPPENGTAPWTTDVTLQVSDGTLTDTQSFTINVTPVNDAPSITSVAPTTATEDAPYSYQLVISDADDSNNGTDITFSLTNAPAGMTISSTGLVEWTPANGETSADVTVQAADGGENGAAAATQSWTITVTAVNDAPTITSVAPTSATEDLLYSYQLVISDVDDSNNGTDISFSLSTAPAGMTVSSTGLIEWTPPNGVTSADVTVQAADGGEDGAAPAVQSWTISVAAVNDAPVITEGASVGVTMSEDGTPTPFSLTLNATDADGDTLFWSIQSAASNGTAGATGSGNSKVITYTPAANFSGSDSFVVRVSDSVLFDDITVNVTVESVNDAPVITSSAVTTATEDTAYSYDVNATDSDGPSLTFSLTTAPAGMTINPTTGVISWTPGEGGATPWNANVTVEVTDGTASDSQSFVISVTPVNDAPVITEGASVSVTMSENSSPTPFSLTLNATDVDSATLTWSIVTPAASGAATASGTGGSKAISYTPNLDYAGSDSFVVRVSDGALSDDIMVNVTIEQVNTPPSISSTPVTEGYEGIPYQYDVEASDADGGTLTYSLITAPAGMTINSSTGLIDWLPGDNGGTNDWDADVVVSVTDGTEAVTQSFTINVEVDRAVHGRGVKGVLSNALVEASLYDAGTDTWTLLATTTTNAAGVWGFDLPTQSAPVRIRLTTTASTLMVCDAPAGCGAAAFGETFYPDVDITLDAIVPGSRFSGPIAVTPLTNMAAQWIDDMPGGVNDDVILLAQRRVATLFGLNEAFTYSRAIDITRPIEVSTALASDSNRVRHALFAASVQELAATQAITIASANQGLAQMFSLLGGQLLLQTGTIDLTEYGLDTTDPTVQYNGLDLMVSSAQAVGAQVNVGGALDTLLASFDTLVSTWGGRALSALGEGTGYNAANFARALAPLDEFDYYYGLAEAAEAGIDEANRSVGWMYIDETAQTNTANMITAFSNVLSTGFQASICVPARRNGSSCDITSVYTASLSSCSLFSSTCRTTITGTLDGQTVNVTIATTPDIRYLLGGASGLGVPGAYDNSNGITLCFTGTISNSTAVMTLTNFCVNPNLSNNDMSEFDSFTALNYTNETMVNDALANLIADIYIYFRAYGAIRINNASGNPPTRVYNMQNFDGNFTFNRRQITQPSNPCNLVRSGFPCSMITVNGISLNRTNPAGETLDSISGTDMFNLVLDDTSTLHIANDAQNLGLPEIRSITDVTITGLAPLNDVISEYLLSMIDSTVPAPEVDWDQLQLDLADAVPSGTSTMEIFDTTNKLYTFTLNADGTVDVSQVNSLSNAMTIDLKGVAGYIYADETLVGTGHLGNSEDGLLLSLVNDTQRSYANANPSATSQLDGLIALFQQLFPPAPEPAP